MATATLGTASTSVLTAIQYQRGGLLPADIAAIGLAILDDSVPIANAPIFPGAFIPMNGQLFIPNRGVLQVLPGAYIAVDGSGWPILLSARAAADDDWVHSP